MKPGTSKDNPIIGAARKPRLVQLLLRVVKLTPGDEIVCVVNKAKPISVTSAASNIQKVRRGDVRRAVVVRVKKEVQRPDGRTVR